MNSISPSDVWPETGPAAWPGPASQFGGPSDAMPLEVARRDARAPGRDDGAVELEVLHETVYTYQRPVELAHHIAFLRPRDDSGQRLLSFTLDIEPAPPRRVDARDVFGNLRSLFSLTASHQSLRVLASSRVLLPLPLTDEASVPPWEACRDHWRYESHQPLDEAVEFTFVSPLLPHHAVLAEWARAAFAPGRALDAAAIALMHQLHEEFAYVPLSTHVGTPVLEAFERRCGVCQDFAHVMIASLRALGLAARYVSGYLLTEPPPGQPKLQGADASHAWVAVAVPRADGSVRWLELDPTNDCIAGQSHVRLAVGRDYNDVTPLSGIIRGGGQHRLEVGVTTRRL